MSHIANDRLLEEAHAVADWADELSEVWTNTATGRIIEEKQGMLLSALESYDLELLHKLTLDLSQMCSYADSEYTS